MKLIKIIENKIKDGFYYIIRLFLNNKKIDCISNTSDIKKVLILRYDVLGDMICTYPAIKYIKSELPDVKIDILASESNSFLIKDDKSINNIYHFNGKILSNIKYLLKIKKNNYDVIFATYYINLTKNGVLANILGNSNCIKANVYDKEKRYLFFNFQSKVAQSKANMFEKMYYLVADSLGNAKNIENIQLSIPRKIESKTIVQEFLKSKCIEKYIIVNISSGKENRKWSNEKLIQLINELQLGDSNLTFIITSMSKDKHDALIIVEKTSNSFYFGESTIFDVIELVDKAELVITPDTSIVHICSVVKTKVCVFTFKSIVDEGVWTPYRVPNRLMIAKTNENMKDIPVDRVLSSVQELLNE
ncbi:MAG: glycosyltransferase family 9 protein [Candidatus Kapaibacterium sp.]